MKTYRVILELRSGLGTPLAADTLWGHIAWGIRYRHGEAALLEWLARFDRPEPPLVISDPFPAGFFPRPQIPPVSPAEKKSGEEVDVKEIDETKRLGKVSWIDSTSWEKLAERLSSHGLVEALRKSQQPPKVHQMAVTRGGINRLTQSTMQPGGAALFTQEHYYYEQPQFEVWAISPEDPATVEQWFRDGLVGGYGRDASAGLGWLEVIRVDPANIPAVANANAGILLAPTVPRSTDPVRGFFRLGIRCGRVGGDFAFWGPNLDLEGPWQRQKRPVLCLLPGSVMVWDAPPPLYVGRTVAGVHPQLPTIRHYGMSPVLPCRLDPDLLNHPFLQGVSQLVSADNLSEVSI